MRPVSHDKKAVKNTKLFYGYIHLSLVMRGNGDSEMSSRGLLGTVQEVLLATFEGMPASLQVCWSGWVMVFESCT